ncbi:SDR family oxidoreductase [uncultured Methanoregula sp.]|uniref:SDR family NAD(P)-dependent oxidoreductase n=1 Tax=uncultured Methanoregula sp. TaxID=1005933 RepID=UPI002AAC0C50|nr:SDR family oxidoreductase [uncultured Methanoregula sp.]
MKKTVVITGASSGIGNAAARLFSREGWHVIGISRRKAERIEGVDHYISADLSKPEDIRNLFSEIEHDEGSVDALVNNAALQICKPLVETTIEEWDAVFDTNVRSFFYCSKLAYPLMAKHGGAIVNISSVHAIATSANIAAYAASKGAIKTMTRNMAIEFAPKKIRVNAVLPGAVDTPMLRSGMKRGHLGSDNVSAQLEELAQRTVIGRVGSPDEIAQAILFLADSERSSFITGQSLVVDGGATIRLSTE